MEARPVIAAVTLNPAFDVTLELPALVPGGVARVRGEMRQASGKGINVAMVLRTLGADARAYCLLGKETASQYRALLGEDAGELRALEVPGATRENLTLNAGGETYKVNRAGAMKADARVLGELSDLICAELPEGAAVAVSGSLPGGVGVPELRAFCGRLRDAGLRVALDCDGPTLRDILEIRPWLIKPNDSELAALFGESGCDDEVIRRHTLELARGISECEKRAWETRVRGEAEHASRLRRFAAPIVAVSLGAQGMLLASQGKLYEAAAAPITQVSDVGAGDSALAGLIFALARGETMRGALKLAGGCGAATAALPGSTLCAAADARRLAAEIEVRGLASTASSPDP